MESILPASAGGSKQKRDWSFVFAGVQLRGVRETRGKINTGSNWARIRSGYKAGSAGRSAAVRGWMLTGSLSHEHAGDPPARGGG